VSRIRVVHLITKLELGGAQRNTIFTCENLDPGKFEAWLMSGEGGILLPDMKEGFSYVKDLVREIRPLRDFRAYRFLVEEFRKLKPDVVHTHSSKAGILGRMAAKNAGVSFTVHSVHGFSFSPHQSFIKRTLFKLMEKYAAPLTDHFIFVARGDMQTAEAMGLLKKASASLIRSGFDFSRFTGRKESITAVKKKYNIGKDDFVCGIIAPFKPQKGLHNLIRIATHVLRRDNKVLFFIAGDGEQREELEYELKISGMADRFRLPGFIHDIENVIPIFDIGVSTALWEGLPQSLVQMRLLKKAVVATDIPGNNEIIRDGLNGFTVKVDHIEEFADKILYLKDRMAVRNAFASYEEDLTGWDGNEMVRAQEDLYAKLMRRKEN